MTTKKKTVGTVADAMPTSITVELLTSKRFWFAVLTALGFIVKKFWGIDIDEDTKVLAINEAITLGAEIAQIIGIVGVVVTKYLDEKKK